MQFLLFVGDKEPFLLQSVGSLADTLAVKSSVPQGAQETSIKFRASVSVMVMQQVPVRLPGSWLTCLH